MGGVSPYDLEALMDDDLEVHHHEALKPAQALAKVGDALPGLGIVAAVLGVVITMGAIDGPPSEIGHKVGAALVGTFLGILLSYGFVGPMATALEHKVDFEGAVPRHHQGRRAGARARAWRRPSPSSSRAARSRPSCGRRSPRPKQYCRAPQADAHAEARMSPGRPADHHQEEEGRRTTAITAARGRSPTPTS